MQSVALFLVALVLAVGGVSLLRQPERLVTVSLVVLAATLVEPVLCAIIQVTGQMNLRLGALVTASFFCEKARAPAMGLVLVILAYRLRSGRDEGYTACYNCGYDLTGNVSGVCPECGTEVAQG